MSKIDDRDLVYDNLCFTYLRPDDPILEGKEIPADIKCRVLPHDFFPSFYILAHGDKVATADPHELLYALADGRLTFQGEMSKGNFVEILNEKLVASERLAASLKTASTIAAGALGVISLCVGGFIVFNVISSRR